MMTYSENAIFPSDNIDPQLKGRDWCLQYAKAAWRDNEKRVQGTIGYRNSSKYDEIRLYCHGRQPNNKYKKAMGVDEQTNTTWLNINFEILPVIKKHRQIALGRLQKTEYNIVATPVDAQAKDELDQYYADIKAKILLRQTIAQQQPELLSSPQLASEPNEPQDLEELEMQTEFGMKHNMAMEAELGIQVMFEQNDMTNARYRILEDLFDLGFSAYKDWVDENSQARFRVCDPRNMVMNFCRYPNFNDLLYVGEVVTMTIHDLKQEAGNTFTDAQYEEMAAASRLSTENASTYVSNVYDLDNRKVKILDLEWFSIDEYVYEMRVNRHGNLVVGKADYNARNNVKDKYKRKRVKMLYRGKWIIGTDYIYNYGLANYIKRDRRNPAEAYSSYHLAATNFYEMTAKGIMEDLIPIADQVQIAWCKLQNIRNQLLPFLIEIDLTALENVAFGKGGEVMQPKELLEMMFQTGIMVTRRSELMTGNNNYKSVEYIQTNYGEAIAEAWNDLNANINLIREATGFNELTDGSTPNPKTLTTPAQMAYESTNNALYHIAFAEKELLLRLARGMFCRLQRLAKDGNVQGYAHSLGTNSLKFLQVSADVSLYDMAITLEDKPNAEQKMKLQQNVLESRAKGELDITDAILIENTQNISQAEQLMAFRIKKRRERMHQEALQLQAANTETQIKSAQAAEVEKRMTLTHEYDLELRNLLAVKEKEKELLALELEVKYRINQETLENKKEVQEISNEGKEKTAAAKP